MLQHTGLHTSAWPLIPEVSNTAIRADLKLNQQNLDHRSMFRSIASCWPLLVEIKKEKTSSVISLTLSCLVLSCLLSCRTSSQCMLGRFFIPRARVNMALDTRQILEV